MPHLKPVPNNVNQPNKGGRQLRQLMQGSIGLAFIQKIILWVKYGMTLCWCLVGLILAGFCLANIYKVVFWLHKYLGILLSKLPYWGE